MFCVVILAELLFAVFFLEINKMCSQLCCADVFLFLNLKSKFLCIWDFRLFIHLWHCWREHSLCLCFKNPASKLYYAWVDFRVLHCITHIWVKVLHATIKHRVIYRFTTSKQVHPMYTQLCHVYVYDLLYEIMPSQGAVWLSLTHCDGEASVHDS